MEEQKQVIEEKQAGADVKPSKSGPNQVMEGTYEMVHLSAKIVRQGGEDRKMTNPNPYVAPKVQGRNEACACKSGKKYKNCCGGAK